VPSPKLRSSESRVRGAAAIAGLRLAELLVNEIALRLPGDPEVVPVRLLDRIVSAVIGERELLDRRLGVVASSSPNCSWCWAPTARAPGDVLLAASTRPSASPTPAAP
jgi:hypothetical protein